MDKNIIENQIQMASTQISVGLSSEEYSIVRVELARLINTALEPEFKTTPPDPNLEKIVLFSSKRIIGEVVKIPPEQRLEYIQTEILHYEIGKLDWDCREIAEKSIADSPDMPALQARAKENLEKVEGYYRFLEEKVPSWERKFGRQLSEARLDCEFVLGASMHSSLRLGRTIQILQQHGSWPPDWYREIWMKDK